ncbi:hypothetical protein LCGC14_0833020 [marine sediment metagenome]|uniref:Uncharacterized protein n=1 Tax=marine sediment metagenome TaxID=412755 RepID=A0A0F9PK29_9ZZZZ
MIDLVWEKCESIRVWVKEECKGYSDDRFNEHKKSVINENTYPKYKFTSNGLFIEDVVDEPFICFIPYHQLLFLEIDPLS